MQRYVRRLVIAGALLVALLVAVGIGGYGFERDGERRDAALHPPPGKLVDVGGRNLHIHCLGNGSPTVVIETGAGAPSFLWWPLQERISKLTRVCTHDRAGLGWSDGAPMGRSIEDRATELQDALTGGEVSAPYVVIAHSYGALIALRFAREHRDTIRGIVFVDAADEDFVYATSFLQSAPSESAGFKKTARETRFGLRRMQFMRMSDEQKAKELGIPRALLERIGLTAAGISPAYYEEYADEMNSFTLTPSALRHSAPSGALATLPIVVLRHGKPFTGALAPLEQEWSDAQTRLSKLSDNAELIVAQNSGHEIYRDEPDLIVAAVERVLNKSALPKPQ